MKKEIALFVSYQFQTNSGENGFGFVVIGFRGKPRNSKDIIELTEYIEKYRFNGEAEIVPISFQALED